MPADLQTDDGRIA